jgi:hypothetical protein
MAKVAEKSLNKYYPKLRQYNRAGIKCWILGNEVEISARGYTPRSLDEQEAIEALIRRDSFCGIARHGQQEMSTDAKKAVTENIQLKHELEQTKAELNRMKERETLRQAAGGPAKGA